jgi:hypothetical protein
MTFLLNDLAKYSFYKPSLYDLAILLCGLTEAIRQSISPLPIIGDCFVCIIQYAPSTSDSLMILTDINEFVLKGKSALSVLIVFKK